jgi:hypothetical protein
LVARQRPAARAGGRCLYQRQSVCSGFGRLRWARERSPPSPDTQKPPPPKPHHPPHLRAWCCRAALARGLRGSAPPPTHTHARPQTPTGPGITPQRVQGSARGAPLAISASGSRGRAMWGAALPIRDASREASCPLVCDSLFGAGAAATPAPLCQCTRSSKPDAPVLYFGRLTLQPAMHKVEGRLGPSSRSLGPPSTSEER